MVLTVNNISGAGMLTLPRVFQQSGWVIPTLVFVVICVSSSLAATFLTDAMARIPGNSHFDLRVEFACIFGEFFGPGMKHVAQVMLMLCFYSQIIAGIVASAQVVDGFIVFLNPDRTTYALQFLPTPHIISWTAPAYQPDTPKAACGDGDEVPFLNSDTGIILTLGYLLLCLALVPFAFGTLDDNITGQKLSFLLLLCFSTVFIAQFAQEGLVAARVPAFGASYRDMLGSIIFNYAFIVMVPSWLNEKRAEVSVNRTVWSGTVISTILYLLVGITGGLAYDSVQGNFLNSLASHCNPALTRFAAFLFAIVCVGLSVPIFCIMVRYNLIVDGLCSDRWAVIFSVVLPFAFSWVFYHGRSFNDVVSWSGVVNNGPVNFILPLLVALRAVNVAIKRIQHNRTGGRRMAGERDVRRSGSRAYGIQYDVRSNEAASAGRAGQEAGGSGLEPKSRVTAEGEGQQGGSTPRLTAIQAADPGLGLSSMHKSTPPARPAKGGAKRSVSLQAGAAAGSPSGLRGIPRASLLSPSELRSPLLAMTAEGAPAGRAEEAAGRGQRTGQDGTGGAAVGRGDERGGGKETGRGTRIWRWLCCRAAAADAWLCCLCLGLGVPRRSLVTVVEPLPKCLLPCYKVIIFVLMAILISMLVSSVCFSLLCLDSLNGLC